MALRVKEDNFEEEILKSKLPVVLEFYSDSCIPCKQMAVILGDLEEEYEDRIKTAKVNVNFDQTLAELYQVMASPTILMFKDGNEINRITGITKKSVLKEMIDIIL